MPEGRGRPKRKVLTEEELEHLRRVHNVKALGRQESDSPRRPPVKNRIPEWARNIGK